MLTAEQKQSLSKLPKATLINFVAEVQGVDKLLDKRLSVCYYNRTNLSS